MNRKEWLGLGLIFLVGLWISVWGLFWPINQDEGVFLTIANQIHHGWVPYRDIFDHKTPGIYFLLAGITTLVKSVIALRIVFLAINMLGGYLIFLIAKRLYDFQTGLAAFGIYMMTLPIFEGHLLLTEVPMAFLLILSVFCFIKGSKSGLFLSGFAMALSILFKQPAMVNVLILFWIIIAWKENRLNIINFTSGFVIAFMPVILYFSIHHGLIDFLNQAWIANITSYPPTALKDRIISWIGLFGKTAWLWIMSVWGARTISKDFKIKKDVWADEAIILYFAIVPLPILLMRQYPHYFLQILPFLCILAAKTYFLLKKQRLFAQIALLTFGVVTAVLFTIQTITVKLPITREQWSISEQIKKSSNASDTIYASRFFTGIYYLADRSPTSKFLYINEINQKLNAQLKVTTEIKTKKPKYILWHNSSDEWRDPYTTKIGDLVRQSYRPIQFFENTNLVLYESNER